MVMSRTYRCKVFKEKRILKNKIWPKKYIKIYNIEMLNINLIKDCPPWSGFLKRTEPTRCSWLHNLQKGASSTIVHLAKRMFFSHFVLCYRGCKETLPLGRGWMDGNQLGRLNSLLWGQCPVDCLENDFWDVKSSSVLKLIVTFHVHPGKTTSVLDAALMEGRGCSCLRDFPGPGGWSYVGGLMIILLMSDDDTEEYDFILWLEV